jgi:hypothetical protein
MVFNVLFCGRGRFCVLLHQQAAEQDRSKSPTSDDSRDFRTSARWSGSVNAIERAIPAQFNALREGIDIVDGASMFRNKASCVLQK